MSHLLLSLFLQHFNTCGKWPKSFNIQKTLFAKTLLPWTLIFCIATCFSWKLENYIWHHHCIPKPCVGFFPYQTHFIRWPSQQLVSRLNTFLAAQIENPKYLLARALKGHARKAVRLSMGLLFSLFFSTYKVVPCFSGQSYQVGGWVYCYHYWYLRRWSHWMRRIQNQNLVNILEITFSIISFNYWFKYVVKLQRIQMNTIMLNMERNMAHMRTLSMTKPIIMKMPLKVQFYKKIWNEKYVKMLIFFPDGPSRGDQSLISPLPSPAPPPPTTTEGRPWILLLLSYMRIGSILGEG